MTPMENETLGAFLKRIREKKGISQSKLAKLAGVDRPYIVQVEKGKVKSMRLSQAKKLAGGLGVRPEIFLSDKDSESLYLSDNIFKGILEEMRQRFDLS